MTKRHHTKLVHEGKYVAEVEIELIDIEEGWAPYLSLDDVAALTRRTDVRHPFGYSTKFAKCSATPTLKQPPDAPASLP